MNSVAIRKLLWPTLIVGVGAALLLFFFDPARVPIYPVCTFHRITGLNCPGCGSLRAMHELLHGNLRAALHFNAFVVLSLALFAWLGCRLIRRKLKNDSTPVIRPFWLWIYLAAFLTFGILRELPVPLFAAFAP